VDNIRISSRGEKYLEGLILGISDISQEFDYDFFDYKGKQLPLNIATDPTGDEWNYETKGFHYG
jgi:hypothetical protein